MTAAQEQRRYTGWTKGRILTTRLLAAAAVVLIFVTTHPTEIHGMKDIALGISGLLLVLISIKGRLWCMLYIGGHKDKKLVTDGPYARCRNPLYFYSLLGVAGIGAASGMFSVITILLALFLAGYYFVIRAEERKLLQLHGQSFEQYCATVPRFWPSLAGIAEVEKHEFSPKLFHRTFWDAVGFLAGWLAVAVIHTLHAMDMLPQWMWWP